MPRVYVSVGSNIDRERNIRAALAHLKRRHDRLILSPIYENPAVGFMGEPFYNLVVGFDSNEGIEPLQHELRAIEHALGRRRSAERFAPRTADLDLLTYGDIVRHDLAPPLPRPDIVRYDFVLRPLADIAAGERHPEIGLSYGELWREASRAHEHRLCRLALRLSL